ncbi:hypothetical protein ABK040_014402 [Willaertia magna]
MLSNSSALSDKKIGFIGTGAMNGAIIRSLVDSKVVNPSQIFAFDSYPAGLQNICKETNINQVTGNHELIVSCDVIVLGVKPQQIPTVLSEKRVQESLQNLKRDLIVISIAAGVKLQTLSEYLINTKVVRVMPNICCLVGQSASAFVMGENCQPQDEEVVQAILTNIGKSVKVTDESYLDAVTGLSGSGPAFVFIFIEALADAGVYCGLPRETALTLAAQTVLGSAEMVLKDVSNQSPAQLKDKVCSPAGTTARGIFALEDGGFRGIVMKAVMEACNRSKELGQKESKL